MVFFPCSSVEQPDVVFSVEQTRSGLLSKTESPNTPQDSGFSDSCESDAEPTPGSAEAQDLDPSSSARLFLKLKEEPEEILQLAPESGDAVVLVAGDTSHTQELFLLHTPSFKLKGAYKFSVFVPAPVELSFSSPLSPESVPDHPQELCTPQLRQLLSPIFDTLTPSSSPESALVTTITTASKLQKVLVLTFPFPQSAAREEVMDIGEVERFFALCPEDVQKKTQTLEVWSRRMTGDI